MADLSEQLARGLADRYRLERELGRGGMATVYLVQDLKHDRPVALKVLLPELAASLGPDRFQREIKLAARLQHPHILTVHDSGETAGQLWFTMPFVEGESLRDRLRRERQLPVEDALRITREAAQALQYAHDHGVVHRDIKPENLLLTKDGNTLVADFGIARAVAGDEHLTQTGMSVGTPAYMSPEQASGDKALDARTDIYSLGAVLYEMLAGEPPFTGPSAQAIIVKRLTEPVPSVRKVRPSVPEAVEEALQRALAPIAADRFSSPAEFARALAVPATGVSAAPTHVTAPVAATTPTPIAVRPTTRKPRRLPLAAITMGLGFLVGLGVLFAWRRTHVAEEGTGSKRLAVLPFENVGDSADGYFADGITDEVRGKLSQLSGLAVIARASSNEYRNTTKAPQEIARELGADYLLTATVQWEKAPGGPSRVRVSPELIRVEPGAAPTTKWQQPFDASLTDVFQVQADIAGRVAQALDVAIGTQQQRALQDRPTRSLAAYDAYLKGEAEHRLGLGPATLRQAIGFLEQAVALDSGFTTAWAALSEANSLLYVNGTPAPTVADRARSAAERALALDPKYPSGYRALGTYHRLVTNQSPLAVEYYSKGLALAPRDANLLRGLGLAEQALGRWEQAVEHLRESRSLDPRSANIAGPLGEVLLWLRRYEESLQALDHSLALEPAFLNSVEGKAMVFLAQGDLDGARSVLRQPPPGIDLPSFVAYMATYWDLYWALTPDQRALVKRLRPAAFDGDAGYWGLALAGVHEVEGDMRRAAAYGDSARAAFEQQLTATPDNKVRRVLLGVALGYMGRKEAAIREGEQGSALLPVTTDAVIGAYLQHQLVRIYLLVGEPEKALDMLEPLLKIPYYLSPGWLKIDPTFAPLRGNPRFERLMAGPES